MPIDFASPGFEVKIISTQKTTRIQGVVEPRTGGTILDRVTDVTDRIESFVFEDEEKDQDILRLTVDNRDLFFLENEVWAKGNLIRFIFGYPGKVFGPRIHVIESWTGFETLKVQAIQEFSLLNKARTTIYENKTIAQVVRQILAEGTFFEIRNLIIDEREINRILGGSDKPRDWTQSSITDLQMLQYLAEQVNFEVFSEGDTLFFQPRGKSKEPIRKFFWLAGVGDGIASRGQGDLKTFNIDSMRTVDLPAEVEVCAYDPIERKEIVSVGSDATTKRPVQGPQSPLELKAGRAGKIAGRQVIASPETDASRIKAEADARFTRAEDLQIEASATIIGDPFLPAKANIQILGISQMLSGTFYVTRHVHSISGQGVYEGKLKLTRNATGEMPLADPPETDKANAEENLQEPPTDRRQSIVARQGGGFRQQSASERQR